MTADPPSTPFAGHDGPVRAVAFAPDGRTVLTGGDDKVVRVWDLATGEQRLALIDHGGSVLAVAVTGDGATAMSVADDGEMFVWDLRDGAGEPHSERASQFLTVASVAPAVAMAAAIDIEDRLLVWSPVFRHRRLEAPIELAAGMRVRAVAAGPEGSIVVASEAGPVLRYQLAGTRTAMPSAEAPVAHATPVADAPFVQAIALAARGVIAAGTRHGAVLAWGPGMETSTSVIPRHLARQQLGQLSGGVSAVAISEDGRHVVAGGPGGAAIAWDRLQPDDPLRLFGHTSRIRAGTISPDGRLFVAGADDGTIRGWELATGALVFGPGYLAPPQPQRAGVRSDEASAVDLLAFGDDVNTLAALIADRATEPPLAVALLGQWGAGKSSFMLQLHDRVAALTSRSRQHLGRGVFAANVRQVRFNAWHYSDDHLWVGLVEHVFANLAEPEAPADYEQIRQETDNLRARLRDLHSRRTLADEFVVRPRPRAALRLLGAWLRSRRGAVLAWSLVAVLTVSSALAVWLLSRSVIAALVAAVVAVVAALTPVVTVGVKVWRLVRGLPGSLRERIERQRRLLDSDVRDVEARLSRLDAAQRLARLIEEFRADRYERYRGLLGKVHGDMRRLSDDCAAALAAWRSASRPGQPPLERVVLYIDDLDRCPPRKVVEVLAAVHLLLALPLFVVVVAVDPRWLRRCLAQHTELFGDVTIAGEDAATPLVYLDKIFQVVFALRPMGAAAERFVEALLPVGSAGSPDPPRTPPNRAEPGEVPPAGGGGQTPTGRPPDQLPTGLGEDRPDPQPEQLRLRDVEVRFVRELCPLLATPRAVKRLGNLYRLVRIGVPSGELDRFVGSDGAGPYQAVLILLTTLIARPALARQLICELGAGTSAGDITEIMSNDDDEWLRRLVERIATIRAQAPVHGDPATYREWAGTVARFSFETWDLVTARE